MTGPRRLRADLHVHSYHSGYASNLRALGTRDSYSDPDEIYRVAKSRGMDLVTITDHDSIGGCLEFLDRHPDASDFFISEEIECRYPGRRLKVHIGAYDITERIHDEVQRYRQNVFDAVAYLRQQHVCFVLNHPLFFFQGQLPLQEYLEAMLAHFDGFEVRNGAMLAAQNGLVEQIVREHLPASGNGVLLAGGSDAHTLRRVGTTYTEVHGETREQFLDGLRAGRAWPGGRHGSTWDIAAEIYGVFARYWQSLAGLRRHDLEWPRRIVGIGCALASVPFEFAPLAIAAAHKTSEARRMAACRRALGDDAPAAAPCAVSD